MISSVTGERYGKEKTLEISFEIGSNLTDEEALKQGVALRRKGNLLLKLRKSTAEAVFKCFDEALFRFKFILDNPQKNTSDEFILTIPEIAQAFIDKATAINEIGAPPRGDSDTYHGLLEQVVKYVEKCPPSELTTEILLLQAQSLYGLSKYKSDGCNDFAGSEKLLVSAAETLVRALKLKVVDEGVSQLLDEVSEALQSGKKHRQRNGKAVYHICGEFYVCRGIAGAWKSRFFVVDDSSVCFFKDKKLWESGPVVASSKVKASATIMFSEILDIFTHEQDCPVKSTSVPSTLKDSSCLHIQTGDKCFDLLSPVGSQVADYVKWCPTLKEALWMYQVKRDIKPYTTKKSTQGALSSFNFDEEKESGKVSPRALPKRTASGFFSIKDFPKKVPTPPPSPRNKTKKNKNLRVSWPESALVTLLPTETSIFPFYQQEGESPLSSPRDNTSTPSLDSHSKESLQQAVVSLVKEASSSQLQEWILKLIALDPKKQLCDLMADDTKLQTRISELLTNK